jgi:uncharacterized membrane protein
MSALVVIDYDDVYKGEETRLLLRKMQKDYLLDLEDAVVLVRKATPDIVLEELRGAGGKILKTSLTHEDEAKLQAALSAVKA